MLHEIKLQATVNKNARDDVSCKSYHTGLRSRISMVHESLEEKGLPSLFWAVLRLFALFLDLNNQSIKELRFAPPSSCGHVEALRKIKDREEIERVPLLCWRTTSSHMRRNDLNGAGLIQLVWWQLPLNEIRLSTSSRKIDGYIEDGDEKRRKTYVNYDERMYFYRRY